MKFLLDKLYKKTRGYYPFFKYCPAIYRNYYLKKRAFDFLGYEYNYEDPKTLNEKIRWLIYNEKFELKTKLTDKILVKGYIASKIGKNHSAELYGIYDNFEEIDFSVLPEKIAIKANHGWRMNIFVQNKSFIYKNYKQLVQITRKWLNTNYEDFSLEPQYRNIKRKLFVEQLRETKDKIRCNEFQIYCFNSVPVYCEIRKIYNDNLYFPIFDTNWKLQNFTLTSNFNEEPILCPERFEEMLEYSKILSQGFSFARVDFVIDGNDIHVVEITFTPCSAMIPFLNYNIDLELGSKIKLPVNTVNTT